MWTMGQRGREREVDIIHPDELEDQPKGTRRRDGGVRLTQSAAIPDTPDPTMAIRLRSLMGVIVAGVRF